jgi:exosortase B
MSTVLASPSMFRPRIPAAVLAIGFLSMVVPTLISLASQAWSKDEGIHGPIVLATGIWLIWRRWDDIAARAVPGSPLVAWTALGLALLVYIFGRAFDFISLEAMALIGVGMAIAYSFIGLRVLQSLWFPIFYLLFLVPMPGWFVDQITAPLKQFVSYSAETLLSSAGYAIARQGVVLYVDQYQLLVKDACAGLNSLFSLTSISLFYIYLRHNASWRYALFLVLWIIPIAILANIIRVIVLVLITHYWGEEAAQGFLHNSAGMLMFVIALLGIFVLDSVFEFLFRHRRARP